jgi:hypothetical protein
MWATNSFLQCHYVETDELVTSVTFDETESSCGPERTLAYDRRDAARLLRFFRRVVCYRSDSW